MSRKPSSTKITRSGRIPAVPRRILSGREPMAERYSGNWQSVESKARPVTREELERVTAKMDAAISDSGDVAADRKIWPGRVYQLAQAVKNQWDEGEFGEISLEQAFKREAERYVRPDGRSFNPRSLRESLRRKADELTDKIQRDNLLTRPAASAARR